MILGAASCFAGMLKRMTEVRGRMCVGSKGGRPPALLFRKGTRVLSETGVRVKGGVCLSFRERHQRQDPGGPMRSSLIGQAAPRLTGLGLVSTCLTADKHKSLLPLALPNSPFAMHGRRRASGQRPKKLI